MKCLVQLGATYFPLSFVGRLKTVFRLFIIKVGILTAKLISFSSVLAS